MVKSDDLSTWKLLVQIADSGGLLAACDVLQCDPAAASRAIKSLEKECGIEFFDRQSKPIVLTRSGEAVCEKARNLLQEHDTLMKFIHNDNDRVDGEVTIAGGDGINVTEITPAILEFRNLYPEINIALGQLPGPLPDIFTKESGRHIDIAIGFGSSKKTPGIITHHLGEMPFVACASPSYVAKYGLPKTPSDCTHHIGIISTKVFRKKTQYLEKDHQQELLKWKSRLDFADTLSAKKSVLLGAGISPDLPLFHCWEELLNNELCVVMAGWQRPPISSGLYVRESSWEKKRVRLFFEFYLARISKKIERIRKEFPNFFSEEKFN